MAWHFLYFLPLPQGHGSLRPIFPWRLTIPFFSSHSLQVHAGGCEENQFVLGLTIQTSLADIYGGFIPAITCLRQPNLLQCWHRPFTLACVTSDRGRGLIVLYAGLQGTAVGEREGCSAGWRRGPVYYARPRGRTQEGAG